MVRLYADSLGISEIISLNSLLFQAFILSIILYVLGFPLQPTYHLQTCFKCATVSWSKSSITNISYEVGEVPSLCPAESGLIFTEPWAKTCQSQATSSFLQRGWWSERDHLSEGKRPAWARYGLGWDIQSISPGFAEMVAAGLAWGAGDGWKFPFPCTFGKVLNGAPSLASAGLSASSFFPLLFPLLPVDLHTAAALPKLLERVLDSPLLEKAPLFLAGCWKLEGLDSNASGCWTETDGETVRSLEWCQTKAFECGVSGKKDADGLHINLTFFQLILN